MSTYEILNFVSTHFDEPSTIPFRLLRTFSELRKGLKITFPVAEEEFQEMLEKLSADGYFEMYGWLAGIREGQRLSMANDILVENKNHVSDMAEIKKIVEIIVTGNDENESNTSYPQPFFTPQSRPLPEIPSQYRSLPVPPNTPQVESKEEYVVTIEQVETACDKLKSSSGEPLSVSSIDKIKSLFKKMYRSNGTIDFYQIYEHFALHGSLRQELFEKNPVGVETRSMKMLAKTVAFCSKIVKEIPAKNGLNSSKVEVYLQRLYTVLKYDEDLILKRSLNLDEYTVLKLFNQWDPLAVRTYNQNVIEDIKNFRDVKFQILESAIRTRLYMVDCPPRGTELRFIRSEKGSSSDSVYYNDTTGSIVFGRHSFVLTNDTKLLIVKLINMRLRIDKVDSASAFYLFKGDDQKNLPMSEEHWVEDTIGDFGAIFDYDHMSPRVIQALYLRHLKNTVKLESFDDKVKVANDMGLTLFDLENYIDVHEPDVEKEHQENEENCVEIGEVMDNDIDNDQHNVSEEGEIIQERQNRKRKDYVDDDDESECEETETKKQKLLTIPVETVVKDVDNFVII